MVNALWLACSVVDVKKSIEFFTQLGFSFDPNFTDDSAACLQLTDQTRVMLVDRARFSGMIPKPITPRDHSEVVLSLALDSADAVRALAEKAFSIGAGKVNEPEDLGFMFSWAFEDLDGHLWDLFWMSPDRSAPAAE